MTTSRFAQNDNLRFAQNDNLRFAQNDNLRFVQNDNRRLAGRSLREWRVVRWLEENFLGEEIVEGFAAADEVSLPSVDEELGGAGAGVVVRGLAHAVGAGVEQEEEVAGSEGRKGAIVGEEVAGLADGADDVDGLADGDDDVDGLEIDGWRSRSLHGAALRSG